MSFNPSLLHAGSTYTFYTSQDGKTAGPIMLNGAAVPGTATVTAVFTPPTGSAFTRSATYDATTGSWSYAGTTTDFPSTLLGGWLRTWRVVNGAIDVTLVPQIPFNVVL